MPALYRQFQKLISSRDSTVESIQALIQQGVSIREPNEYGFTPLHLAAASNRVEIIDLLVSLGADVNAPTPGVLETPLHSGSNNGHIAAIQALVAHGAAIEAKNVWGGTPLLCAVCRGHVDAYDALRALGADPRAVTIKGENALHLAKSSLLLEHILEERLIDTLAVDADGNTPLHCLVSRGDVRSAMILLANEGHVSVNTANLDMETPLHLASRAGNDAMIQLLLNAGSDVRSENMAGHTAADVAVRQGGAKTYSRLVTYNRDTRQKNGYWGAPSNSKKTLIPEPLRKSTPALLIPVPDPDDIHPAGPPTAKTPTAPTPAATTPSLRKKGNVIIGLAGMHPPQDAGMLSPLRSPLERSKTSFFKVPSRGGPGESEDPDADARETGRAVRATDLGRVSESGPGTATGTAGFTRAASRPVALPAHSGHLAEARAPAPAPTAVVMIKEVIVVPAQAAPPLALSKSAKHAAAAAAVSEVISESTPRSRSVPGVEGRSSGGDRVSAPGTNTPLPAAAPTPKSVSDTGLKPRGAGASKPGHGPSGLSKTTQREALLLDSPEGLGPRARAKRTGLLACFMPC